MPDVQAIDANPREIIGANNPPEPTPLDLATEDAAEYVANGSSWLNDVGPIVSQMQADECATFLREGSALAARIEKDRLTITNPLNKQIKDIKAAFDKQKARIESARSLVEPKLRAYLIEQDRQQQVAREAANKLAKEAEEAARLKIAEARRLEEAAAAGELAGTDKNAVVAIEQAELAVSDAIRRADEAARIAKERVGAGSGIEVDGRKSTVRVREKTRLVLDLPHNAQPIMIAVALGKMLKFIADEGEKGALDAIQQEVGRAVNRIYLAQGVIAPGTREHTETSVR